MAKKKKIFFWVMLLAMIGGVVVLFKNIGPLRFFVGKKWNTRSWSEIKAIHPDISVSPTGACIIGDWKGERLTGQVVGDVINWKGSGGSIYTWTRE